MKVSRTWLGKYFKTPLPPTKELAHALTFHAFEIEGTTDDALDVKVLPNRAADCLSHRGIAKELSAILALPLALDPLREPPSVFPVSRALAVAIADSRACARYMGAVVRNVRVGPSPSWLREALEAVGQRSINNIVDATNYVMLDIGQPLHAFDATPLLHKNGTYRIGVRFAKKGESFTTLSDESFSLSPEALLITDAHADTPIGIAGVKGGKGTEVTEATTDLIIESANFDGTSVRRTAQTLKLVTDAGTRFQNRPSPTLAAYGMRDVLKLIETVAGGELEGVVDAYLAYSAGTREAIQVSLEQINGILGSTFSGREVADIFTRLDMKAAIANGTYTLIPPFERTDLTIPEDIVEEVGRLAGYDAIQARELPPADEVGDQVRFKAIERMKDELVKQGYIEVSTQSFAAQGDVYLANPLDKTKPALRTSLEGNLEEALSRARYHALLVLAPGETPKLFEVGTVFPKEGEHLELRMTKRVAAWGDRAGAVDNLSTADLEAYGKEYEPERYELGAYLLPSTYPFIVRDLAFWDGTGTDAAVPEGLIRKAAGTLLIRLDPFDRFEKEGRVSSAYRLVFQSAERTLTDAEVNNLIKAVSDALSGAGFEVR